MERPICSTEGCFNLAEKQKRQPHHKRQYFSRKCSSCKKRSQGKPITSRRPYLIHRGDRCERCGFEAVHECQLDIHHRDGDHSNNDPANLQTLCANCHRLITLQEWERLRLTMYG